MNSTAINEVEMNEVNTIDMMKLKQETEVER